MKRIIAAVATSVLVAAGAGATIAAAAGAPEVDEANATIQLGASHFTAARCLGEDGVTYETFRGSWKGGETDLTPGSTDYNLTGSLAVNRIVWTVNLKTQRGVLRGTTALTSDTAAAPVKTYTGPITLITQGLPAASTPPVSARGWINAATDTNGAPDGGSLLANVELQILPGFAANGEFGNQTMNFPDFSVATNNQAC